MPPMETASSELTEIELGSKYSDSVTNFTGTATHRCESLTDPDQILLENDESSRWISILRLSPVEDSSDNTSS